MPTITADGVEYRVRYRKVPGYYNNGTYRVDVNGRHAFTVRRISDSTWNQSAVWRAYSRDAGELVIAAPAGAPPAIPDGGHLGTGRSRDDIVTHVLRYRLEDIAPELAR